MRDAFKTDYDEQGAYSPSGHLLNKTGDVLNAQTNAMPGVDNNTQASYFHSSAPPPAFRIGVARITGVADAPIYTCQFRWYSSVDDQWVEDEDEELTLDAGPWYRGGTGSVTGGTIPTFEVDDLIAAYWDPNRGHLIPASEKPTSGGEPRYFRIDANETLYPGQFAQTIQTDNDDVVRVYDPQRITFALHDEIIQAIYRTNTGRWETIAPFGLRRKGVAAQKIIPNGSGYVEVWRNLLPSDPLIQLRAHLNWMHGGQDVLADTEVVIEYANDEDKWWIASAACYPSDHGTQDESSITSDSSRNSSSSTATSEPSSASSQSSSSATSQSSSRSSSSSSPSSMTPSSQSTATSQSLSTQSSSSSTSQSSSSLSTATSLTSLTSASTESSSNSSSRSSSSSSSSSLSTTSVSSQSSSSSSLSSVNSSSSSSTSGLAISGGGP